MTPSSNGNRQWAVGSGQWASRAAQHSSLILCWSFWIRRPAEDAAAISQDPIVRSRRSPKIARLEAVLLVSDVAQSARRLAQLATLADATEARTLIGKLNEAYDLVGTPFRVEKVAAGYRLFTRPEYSLWLGKLHHREAELKLSHPMLETLAIVAYRQPVIRAELETIRGVQCIDILKHLMDRGLVRIAGEDDSLGRPFLYETTRKFLEIFGLRDLEDLPLADRLRRPSAIIPPAAIPLPGLDKVA
ncbi:MAG: SMC-Scp complex subunit ScpB [Planctomycetales bacterium]|nr:SMC-Scp complex subunit ScpB [Planctomycetales bacterium]